MCKYVFFNKKYLDAEKAWVCLVFLFVLKIHKNNSHFNFLKFKIRRLIFLFVTCNILKNSKKKMAPKSLCSLVGALDWLAALRRA